MPGGAVGAKNEEPMKRILSLTLVFAVLSGVCLSAQTVKESIKDRKAMVKMTKKQLDERASKAARREARRLTKEGWVVAPGVLPLEKQLDRAYLMQYEFDETGYPRYILGDAQSIGEHYDAARFQALEIAKINLAGQIQSEIVGLVETNLGNKQLSAEEAASISQTVAGLKDVIAQKFGRVISVMECHRTLNNKNKEVRVMVAYNSKMAMEQARSAIRENLEDRSEELQKKLDSILNF